MQQDFECWGDHTCLNTCGRDEEVQWKWEEEALWRRAVEDQWKAAVEIAEGQWKVPVEIAEGQWKVYVEIAEGQRKALVEIGEGQRKVVGEGLLKLKLVLSRWMFWIVPSQLLGFIWFHAVLCSYSFFCMTSINCQSHKSTNQGNREKRIYVKSQPAKFHGERA